MGHDTVYHATFLGMVMVMLCQLPEDCCSSPASLPAQTRDIFCVVFNVVDVTSKKPQFVAQHHCVWHEHGILFIVSTPDQ